MKKLIYILLLFTCSLQAQIINSYAYASDIGYILDTYSADSAFSFRKLSSTATECCIIRRSSDDATTTILLENSGQISLSSTVSAGGTLGTWLGSDNGFIDSFIDQTGNGNDWFAESTASEPTIATSGVLSTNSNGDIAAYWDGTRTFFKTTFTPITTTSYIFSVFELQALDDRGVIFSGGGGYLYIYDDGSASTTLSSNAGTPSYYKNGSLFTGTTRDDLHTQFNIDTPIISTLSNADLTSWADTFISAFTNYEIPAYISEVIWYDSNQSLNQSTIETDINNFYSIY